MPCAVLIRNPSQGCCSGAVFMSSSVVVGLIIVGVAVGLCILCSLCAHFKRKRELAMRNRPARAVVIEQAPTNRNTNRREPSNARRPSNPDPPRRQYDSRTQPQAVPMVAMPPTYYDSPPAMPPPPMYSEYSGFAPVPSSSPFNVVASPAGASQPSGHNEAPPPYNPATDETHA